MLAHITKFRLNRRKYAPADELAVMEIGDRKSKPHLEDVGKLSVKRSKRTLVVRQAKLYSDAIYRNVVVRNISNAGLMVENDKLPPVDTEVVVQIMGMARIPGLVIWRTDRCAGIKFVRAIAPAEVFECARVNDDCS